MSRTSKLELLGILGLSLIGAGCDFKFQTAENLAPIENPVHTNKLRALGIDECWVYTASSDSEGKTLVEFFSIGTGPYRASVKMGTNYNSAILVKQDGKETKIFLPENTPLDPSPNSHYKFIARLSPNPISEAILELEQGEKK